MRLAELIIMEAIDKLRYVILNLIRFRLWIWPFKEYDIDNFLPSSTARIDSMHSCLLLLIHKITEVLQRLIFQL